MDTAAMYYFTGENAFALEHELMRWKHNFIEKHGIENILVLKGKDCTVSDILDAVSTMPFIAERRLVIMEGIPKIDKEDFQIITESIHPQTVLVIAEAKPDKRLGIVKEIEKACEAKKFDALPPAALAAWIRSHAQSLGSSIRPDAVTLLLSIVGDDQWTLDSEIRKISAYAGDEIASEHVEALAVPSGSQVVWRLTDLIGSRKSEEAIAFLCHRLERGEDVYGLWVILLNMIKNLGLVSAALQAGLRDERAISGGTGIHFFVVRGLLPLAKSMQPLSVRFLVDWAAESDIQLKTGGFRYSAEHPGEVIALAERAILLCR